MALSDPARRRSAGANRALALLGLALIGCSPPRQVDRLVVRLIDVVDEADLAVEPYQPEVVDLALVRGEAGPRVRVRLRRTEAWTLQSEAGVFGERTRELAIWSFRAAFPTTDAHSVRLESELRRLEAWDPQRRPRPYSWFLSPGGFFPRGFHLALPAGVAPGDLGLVAEFAPTPGLELELASPGTALPPTSALVRWASFAGDSRRSLVVPGGGEVRFALEVPARARLRFSCGRRSHPWSEGGRSSRLEVELRGAAGWRSLRTLTFSGDGAAPGGWQDVDVPLDGSDGNAGVELRFRVPEASSRGAATHFVAEPVVVAPAGRDRRPNLVLIVVDGLRADHVGASVGGTSSTPHLDRLARRGLRFSSASAAATWTRPSIASMFTGRLPSAHGVEGEDADSRLPRAVPTLAAILRAAGWSTVALSANPHLDPAFGVSRGFSRATSGLVDGARLEAALAAALEGRDHEPFFLFGFFMDTHWPWTDRAEDREAEAIDARVVDAQRLGRAGSDEEGAEAGPSEAEIRKLGALYRENVRFVDARIGALLERLRELGLDRDTIVVVTADHGEAFGERGAFFHGWNVHRELEHVPLVVAGPGVPRGVRDEPLSLVHLPALLLELLGVQDAALSDRPLARRILDGGAAPSPVVETKFRGSDQAALIEGRWKLVLGRRHGAFRLYDLASDPREQQDRSGAEPHRAERMRAELERRLTEAEAERTTSDEPAEGDAGELGEQLRALGYL